MTYLDVVKQINRVQDIIASVNIPTQQIAQNFDVIDATIQFNEQVFNASKDMYSNLGRNYLNINSNSIENCLKLVSSTIPNLNSFNNSVSQLEKTLLTYNKLFKLTSYWDLNAFNQVYKNRFLGNYNEEFDTFIKSYFWVLPSVSNNNFINKLILESKKQNPNIDNIFIDFFTKDNYNKITELKDKWNNDDFIKESKRNIINAAINLIVNDNGENYSEIIIPSLLAQIDSLMKDIILKNGYVVNENNRNQFIKQNGRTLKPKGHQRTFLEDFADEIINNWEENSYNLLLSTLFTSNDSDKFQETPINFSRHEIMHGVNYSYGTFENCIRCLLIIDFFNDFLSDEVNSRLN